MLAVPSGGFPIPNDSGRAGAIKTLGTFHFKFACIHIAPLGDC